MNILEELYYGNINISERDVKEGSDEQAALSAASDAQIKLMDALPDDLKPLLNNLNAANDSLLILVRCGTCISFGNYHNPECFQDTG